MSESIVIDEPETVNWTTVCQFHVVGIPKGQPRARACIRGRHAGVFDPGTANDWKALVALAARRSLPVEPLTGPVRVDIAFFMPRPQRLCRRKDSPAPVWCTAKPDRDNAEKAVLDVLTQLGMWGDDAQVCAGEVTKHYHGIGMRPGAVITVSSLQ